VTATLEDFGTAPNRQSGLTKLYLTTCSICRLGVYHGQAYVWTRGIYLGTSHAECAADLCAVCGKHFEGLARTGATLCTLCALVLERFGPPGEVARERFQQPGRTRK
jgi:hypothetical protein